ncbi:membrane protein insertion efficiency factor YidD [Geotalea toluenoxydans]|uniref:membrane protein insertion efficiency factor YidD n=1 Tax=Geotalea toluenoxydans TaxID=421624 RepID=UPI001FB438E8|nr:membrane protein insertion efficiency factor YidD [Geotalea toluenoxydans]
MLRQTAIRAIRFYQKFISPYKGASCRFYPSCSDYSLQSFEKHGLLTALWYSVLRILKCHPFHPGGYDPVK